LFELSARDRLARHQDRAVALPHRGAGIHHPVAIGDQQVRRERHGGDVQLRGARAPIERLDVLEHVLDRDARHAHLARGERVEHERVVRVGAVADAYRLH